MNYEEEIKKYLEENGEDTFIFNYFINIETLEYVNNNNPLKFSIWNFILELKNKGHEDKSIQELSHYYCTNLSINGCNSLMNNLDQKMTTFNALHILLSDKFIEFKFLGELDSHIINIVIPLLNEQIEKHRKSFKSYINWILESMSLHKVKGFDVILDKITNHFFNDFHFEKLTAREISRFDVKKADSNKIKNNILEFIESQNQR